MFPATSPIQLRLCRNGRSFLQSPRKLIAASCWTKQLYVSAIDDGFSPLEYLSGIPRERVGQIHLAGHSSSGDLLIDTDDHPVPTAIWRLYREAVRRFGRVSTLVEWDDQIPPFEESWPKQIARLKLRARYSMPTPSLYEVQRLFWESVAVQPGRDSIAPAFVRMVRGYDDSDRKTRIGVYADAYFLRLRDVLREDFLRVAALVGSAQFDDVVRGYRGVSFSMAVGASPGPRAA